MNQKKCKSLRKACRAAATNFTVPKQQYAGRWPVTLRWPENTYRRIYQDTKRSIRA